MSFLSLFFLINFYKQIALYFLLFMFKVDDDNIIYHTLSCILHLDRESNFHIDMHKIGITSVIL